MDQITESIRYSNVLTGNNLGQLGTFPAFPSEDAVRETMNKDYMKELKQRFGNDPALLTTKLHELAKSLLDRNDIETAWKVLLCTVH